MFLRLDYATHESARYACENWHYSKCLPTGKLVKIGAWENDKFIGVVIFSRGASPFLLKKFALKQIEGCELTRVAFTNHKTEITKIISISFKLLKKLNPGLKICVSFADPDKGHEGTIYKAGNWIYTGKSQPTTELFIKGKWRHMRGSSYLSNKNTPKRMMPGKHRFIYSLNKSLNLSKFKCAASKDVVASGFQSEEGGSIPTAALHSEQP